MTQKELFDKSIEKWGLTSQLAMVAEESCELAVASMHLIRQLKKPTYLKALESFAEEIADVELLLAEMKYYLWLTPAIAKFRKLKEKRLEEKLSK